MIVQNYQIFNKETLLFLEDNQKILWWVPLIRKDSFIIKMNIQLWELQCQKDYFKMTGETISRNPISQREKISVLTNFYRESDSYQNQISMMQLRLYIMTFQIWTKINSKILVAQIKWNKDNVGHLKASAEIQQLSRKWAVPNYHQMINLNWTSQVSIVTKVCLPTTSTKPNHLGWNQDLK